MSSRVRSTSWWTNALADLAFAPFACIAAWSLIAVSGIPTTHDGLGIERVETYRRAYAAGDWLPVWTPFMSAGHGSPFPVLYHRLHAQLFGVLALAIGSLNATKASVPILLVVGAAGMRRLVRATGARGWISWVGGLLFLSGYYLWTDWFVRGAIAEFTAFAMIPWCLHFAIEVFEERASPVWLAVSASALFYAHMMTFYFFAYFVLAVIINRLVRMRRFGFRRSLETIRRATVFGTIVLIAILPFAAASQYIIQFSGIKDLAMRKDALAYFSWSATLVDPNFSWVKVRHAGETSVEIGRWPMFALTAALLAHRECRAAVWKLTYGMLVPAIVFFVLQDKRFAFVFELVPGASKVQFPSRLLTFIVPVVLLAWAVAIEHALRTTSPLGKWLAVLAPVSALAQLAVVAQAQRDVRDHRYEEGQVDVALWNHDVTQPVLSTYSTWDLFLPEGWHTVPRTPFVAASPGCTVSSDMTGGAPVKAIEREASCKSIDLVVHGSGCTVSFSQFRTPLLAVDVSNGGSVQAGADETTIIHAPVDGTHVHVRERSMLELLSSWIRMKLRRAS